MIVFFYEFMEGEGVGILPHKKQLDYEENPS